MSKHIVKLMMKVAVLWNEKVLLPETLEPLRAPMLALGTRVSEDLGKRPGSIETEPLGVALRAAYDAILPVIQPHMKVCVAVVVGEGSVSVCWRSGVGAGVCGNHPSNACAFCAPRGASLLGFRAGDKLATADDCQRVLLI
jgi:hypothetical protein